MKITLDWLKEKSACEDGIAWFEGNFGNDADCQDVLDELGKRNRVVWAKWLIDRAGTTNTVLEIQGNIETENSLFFAGKIKVTGKISCKFLAAGGGIYAEGEISAGEGIYAGGEISAGGGISAGKGISAGEGIYAREGISAGEDFGIYAGIIVKLSLKDKYAVVKAKTRPKNLLLGTFVPVGGGY